MSQNPFETPQASAYQRPAAAASGQGAGVIDIGAAINDAWVATTANFGAAIGGLMVAGLLGMLACFTVIGIFAVLPVFMFGVTRLYINLADGRGDVSDVFDGFKSYGHAVGSMLLFMLMMLFISMPGQVMSMLGAYNEWFILSILGNIYGLVIAFFVTFRLYFAPYYIVDQNLGALDAMRVAWDATADQKLMIFLLGMVAGIISMAGMLALLIGLLFTIPLSTMIWACAYRQLSPAPAVEEAGAYY